MEGKSTNSMKLPLISTFIFLFFALPVFSQDNFIYDIDIIGPKSYELFESGQFEKALKEIDKVHFLDPSYTLGVKTRVDFMQSESKHEEVIEFLKPILNEGRFAENPHLYYSLAISYNSLEKYEEAIKVLDRGIKEFPDFSVFYFYRSLAKYDFGKTQSAVEDIKKAILLNPGFPRAHYFLGFMALQKGEIVPGFLSLVGYLAIAPDDEYATETVAMLDKNLASTYKDLAGVIFTREGDDFSELEEILRNNLPLNKKYKLKSKLDYNYSRYLQAVIEYAKDHEIKDGFFENQYIDFLKDIANKDQVAEFIYYTCVSFEKGKIAKVVKRNFNAVLEFNETFILDEFQQHFFTNPEEVDGEIKNIITILDEGDPLLKGELINREYSGDFKKLNEYGKVTGIFPFVDNKINGLASYYDDNGVLTEKTLFKDGMKDGKSTGYDRNGDVTFEIDFKEDVINGTYLYSYLHGGTECIETYKDGKWHGKVECFYKNGSKSSELNYKEGERDGLVTFYHLNGEKSTDQMYKAGKLNGTIKTFDYEGKLVNEYEMKNDDYVYPFQIVNIKGEVVEKGVIENGEKLYSKFSSDGTKTVFHYKGEDVRKIDYYQDDVLLYSYATKNDELVGVTSYLNGKPQKMKGSNITYYDVEGNKTSVRSYSGKFNLNGKSTFYFSNGNISQETDYRDGDMNGKDVIYELNGDLSSEAYYKNDTLHGLFKNYDEGFLNYTCYYNKGRLNGPLTFYKPDGKISQVRFFVNGNPYNEVSYDSDGDKYYEANYLENVIVDFSKYDKGTKIDSFDFKFLTGKKTYSYRGEESMEADFKNGVLNGKYILKYSDGFKEIEKDFINNELHGKVIYYSPTGNKIVEQNVVYGEVNGKAEWFTPNGLKTYECNYEDDLINGISYRYYPDGTPFRVATYKDGDQNGGKFYLSPSGDTLLVLHMKNDVIKSYQVRNMEGGLEDKVMLKKERQEINVKYENGKPALNIVLRDNFIDEKLEIFSKEGKPLVERNRKNGHLDGKYRLYYLNGQMAFEQIFIQNQLEGLSVYYNENGQKEVELESKMDLNHGFYKIYENGKLIKTLTYEEDICVSID